MRIVTGGHAIWMGGWSTQVHLHVDAIGQGGLHRGDGILEILKAAAHEFGDDTLILPPCWALADGLIHQDHRIMPPDEIDPDYLDAPVGPGLRAALCALGADPDQAASLAQAYDEIDRHIAPEL